MVDTRKGTIQTVMWLAKTSEYRAEPHSATCSSSLIELYVSSWSSARQGQAAGASSSFVYLLLRFWVLNLQFSGTRYDDNRDGLPKS